MRSFFIKLLAFEGYYLQVEVRAYDKEVTSIAECQEIRGSGHNKDGQLVYHNSGEVPIAHTDSNNSIHYTR